MFGRPHVLQPLHGCPAEAAVREGFEDSDLHLRPRAIAGACRIRRRGYCHPPAFPWWMMSLSKKK